MSFNVHHIIITLQCNAVDSKTLCCNALRLILMQNAALLLLSMGRVAAEVQLDFVVGGNPSSV